MIAAAPTKIKIFVYISFSTGRYTFDTFLSCQLAKGCRPVEKEMQTKTFMFVWLSWISMTIPHFSGYPLYTIVTYPSFIQRIVNFHFNWSNQSLYKMKLMFMCHKSGNSNAKHFRRFSSTKSILKYILGSVWWKNINIQVYKQWKACVNWISLKMQQKTSLK